MPDRPKPAVAISEDAHYSLDKAVGILGIGKQQIVKLPTDSKRKIDMTQARIVLERAKEKGLDVFVIVATAGTTPVGAFDPIDELADLAHERGVWLHVDGAHGASWLLSEKLRGRLKGIEKADSITWDAHKTMFVPPLCTLLFYKDRAKSYNAFHLDPTYIFDKETSPYLEYDGAVRTFECTKRPAIMNLWFLWSLYGPSLFSALLERTHEQAIAFYRLLKSTNDFVALHQPECNIVSFKYTPPGIEEDQLSLFSEMIRERVLRRGSYCISKLKIDNATVLRVVFSNPLITLKHCKSLLSEIRLVGHILLSEPTFAKQSLKIQKGIK
jgi:L-2,4-diaminobutyrate decarboxylase